MNGGVAFPCTGSAQTFPLNGAEHTTTSKQSFPLEFREKRPRVYEFRPLVGFEFDGGDRLYGYEGHAGATDFYSPKVLSIGEIYKEVPQLWGLYSISSCTVELDNSDKEFSILKATEPFLNRTGWVALCEPYYGEASINRLMTGLIDSWTMQGGKVSVTLRDASMVRFQATANQFMDVLDTALFTDLPEYQIPRLVPVAFGRNTRSVAALGPDDVCIQPLPAYLIDPAISQANYRYVLAQHPVSVDLVMLYGKRVSDPADYTTAAILLGGKQFNCVDFYADPRDFDAHSPDEIEVTHSTHYYGLSTIAANGEMPAITNADSDLVVADLYALFHEYEILDITTELDLPSWADAYAQGATRVSRSQLAITDANITIKEVIARWCETHLGWFYVNKSGLFAVALADQPASGSAEVSDSLNIIRDSFAVRSNPNACSRLQYNFGYNFVGDYFEFQPDLHDAGEEANLGQDIRANRNLWYIRDYNYLTAGAGAEDVAEIAMESMTENTQLVSFSLPIRYHAGIDVTKAVTLTHFEGIDASGLGYDAVTVRILSVRFRPHPTDSRIDVKGIVVP